MKREVFISYGNENLKFFKILTGLTYHIRVNYIIWIKTLSLVFQNLNRSLTGKEMLNRLINQSICPRVRVRVV